jgi:hypothetical protein
MPPDPKDMALLWDMLDGDYGEVRHEILWRICKEKAPELIRVLGEMGASDLPADENK